MFASRDKSLCLFGTVFISISTAWPIFRRENHECGSLFRNSTSNSAVENHTSSAHFILSTTVEGLTVGPMASICSSIPPVSGGKMRQSKFSLRFLVLLCSAQRACLCYCDHGGILHCPPLFGDPLKCLFLMSPLMTLCRSHFLWTTLASG
jgi:hypothetical protein